jgi:hypothetical protein
MSNKYLLKLPGKEDRIIENIVFEKVLPKVLELGGTLELVIEKEPEPIAPTPSPFLAPKRIAEMFKREDYVTYSWLQVMDIVTEIREKHFPALKDKHIRFEQNTRMRKRMLGRAWNFTMKIELAERLQNKDSKYLKQVIFHELCHLEFPGEGHQGPRFRRKERYNPYRDNCGRTQRLSCVG